MEDHEQEAASGSTACLTANVRGQRHGRLRRIAVPLVTWVESPADLGLGGAGIGQGERHLAKDAGLIASAHGKRQLVPAMSVRTSGARIWIKMRN